MFWFWDAADENFFVAYLGWVEVGAVGVAWGAAAVGGAELVLVPGADDVAVDYFSAVERAFLVGADGVPGVELSFEFEDGHRDSTDVNALTNSFFKICDFADCAVLKIAVVSRDGDFFRGVIGCFEFFFLREFDDESCSV